MITFIIIAGQGTAALELLTDHPAPDAIIAPVGGGGLLSGTAIAARHLAPSIKIYGAEPLLADDAARSFHTGVTPAPTATANNRRRTADIALRKNIHSHKRKC